MKSRTALVAVFAMLLVYHVTRAKDKDDDKEPSVKRQIAALVALGPGVHDIQKDKKGRITECVIVGQARISTTLGKAKGLELARAKADLACSAEFVKWLKEGASMYLSSDEESLILTEGEEDSGDESLKESGKSVEKAGKKMESLSKGLVRGLVTIGKDIDGDGKTYTVIKAWKADTAEGVKKIATDLASDEPAKRDGGETGTGKSLSKKKDTAIDKDIKSETVISNDAADFLIPKKSK